MSLSTAQPDIGGAAPQLSTHYIQFKMPVMMSVQTYHRGRRESSGLKEAYFDDDSDEVKIMLKNINSVIERGEDLSLEASSFQKTSRRLKSRSRGLKGKKDSSRRSSGSSFDVPVTKVTVYHWWCY